MMARITLDSADLVLLLQMVDGDQPYNRDAGLKVARRIKYEIGAVTSAEQQYLTNPTCANCGQDIHLDHDGWKHDGSEWCDGHSYRKATPRTF